MTATVYDLYGLRVKSEIPLHECVRPLGNAPDVLVVLDVPRTATESLDATVVAEVSSRGRIQHYVFRRRSGGYLIRTCGLCDFEISADLSLVRCIPDPAVRLDWIPILVRGLVLAVLLELRGTSSLHASAVEVDGRVVAFAGESGSGKSTTAALSCAAGARLVSDDVLSLEMASDNVMCPRGSRELRLRDEATGLLDDPYWVVGKRPLADGRLAIRPRCMDLDVAPLAAVVFPTPWRSAETPKLRLLHPLDAVFRLAAVPRIKGWTCPDVLRRGFLDTARLANDVPVFEAAIPWGPPWRPSATLPIFDAVAGAVA
jgi:hypothetical protein